MKNQPITPQTEVLERSTLSFKAANPDNDVEIKQIVSLVFKLYGDSFPIRSAYDPQFWKTHIGSRFISIIVRKGNDIIGHLAVQPELDFPTNIQVLFPLFEPDYRELAHEILGGAWQMLFAQAGRQKWEMLYSFMFGGIPEISSFLCDYLQLTECAICPGYFPPAGSDANPVRTDVVILARLFAAREFASEPVPARHAEIISYLYEALDGARASADNHRLLTPTLRDGYTRSCFSKSGVCQVFVDPSKLPNFSAPFTDVGSLSVKAYFVFVNIADPKCSEFCESLELDGFKFSGLLPALQGRNSLVYYRLEQDLLVISGFKSIRARKLAEYITGQRKKQSALRPNLKSAKGKQYLAENAPRA